MLAHAWNGGSKDTKLPEGLAEKCSSLSCCYKAYAYAIIPIAHQPETWPFAVELRQKAGPNSPEAASCKGQSESWAAVPFCQDPLPRSSEKVIRVQSSCVHLRYLFGACSASHESEQSLDLRFCLTCKSAKAMRSAILGKLD